MNYSFSIITAVKNSGKTIEKTISSLTGQKQCDYEYIVIDGNSSDNTHNVLSSYKKYINTLIIEPDEGVYHAFNKGLKHATGDIIYFLNAGDFLHDDYVLKDVSDTFLNNHADLVYGNIVWCDENGIFDRITGQYISEKLVTQGNLPNHPSTFVRRYLFDKIGHFRLDFKIASDYDFLLKCFLDKSINTVYLNRPISQFCKGGLSSTYCNYDLMLEETDKSTMQHLGIKSQRARENIKNSARFRTWLEKILLNESGITNKLVANGFSSICIFGTKTIARYLLKDCRYSEITVSFFVDNDKRMIGKSINSLPVLNAMDIDNYDNVDAVVTSVESEFDADIIHELRTLLGERVPVISWKDLIEK